MNRKTVSLVPVLLAVSILFTGCGSKEKILRSTKAESEVIGTVAGFDIPMEIYRYAALNCRADYDNGNSDVWLGESGQELIEKLNGTINETLLNMYTTAAICSDYGIAVDDQFITDSVDLIMNEIYGSHDFDYEAYTDELADYNMNDSVYRFIVRNDVLAEELIVKMTESGYIPDISDRDAFREIAAGDEFIRVKQILVSAGDEITAEKKRSKIEKIKSRLDSGADFDELLWEEGEDVYLFSNDNGYYISRGSFYTEFEDAAFALEIGGISDIIETPAGYCIIRRYEKEDDYIDTYLDDMYATYRDGLYNLALEQKRDTLRIEWNEKAEKYTVFNLKSSR